MKIRLIVLMLQKIPLLCLLVMFTGSSFMQSDELNFDSLFPRNSYVQLLTGCNRICGDLDNFEPKKLVEDQKIYFDDLLVERLCGMHYAFAAMINSNDKLLVDDFVYIEYLVQHIERIYKQRLADVYEPSPTVLLSLHSLKEKIEAVFTQG